MNKFNVQIIFYLIGSFGFWGCGVKGKPQPPLTPILMSRGEPSFSKATEKLKVNPRIPKKKVEGDFEEPDDFEPIPEDKK